MSEPLESSVKDIQDQINSDHPFGLKIWKPALYKKDRSVNIQVRDATRSVPGEMPLWKLAIIPGNVIWAIVFGIILSILYLLPLIILYPLYYYYRNDGAKHEMVLSYIKLFTDLAGYVFWPFGKFITRKRILVDEEAGLLSPNSSPKFHKLNQATSTWKKIQDQGIVGLFYYGYYYLILAPIHLMVSLISTIFIFSIPMAKLNYLLVRHCTRHPLELKVHSGFFEGRSQSGLSPNQIQENRSSVLFWRRSTIEGNDMDSQDHYPMHEREPIVLCLYKALGWKYYKYTIGGINIIVINLFILGIFTILDYFWIRSWAGDSIISSHGFIFSCALLSTIPLAYFIGMAVSSITVQTGNIALGSVINATFGSIIEIILYCFAIIQGRELMVEGAIVGSILCGLLALPGVSMFSGGLIRKEQAFNSKAAGVSTTMLLMSVLGVFSPTIFQMIYGSLEMRCKPCPEVLSGSETCSQCVSIPLHPSKDPIYMEYTRPFMYICACALVMTYGVGLWFTLMTHTDKIYSSTKEKRKPRPIYQIFNFSNAAEPHQGLRTDSSPQQGEAEEEYQTNNVLPDQFSNQPGPSSENPRQNIRRFKRSHSFVTRIPFDNQKIPKGPLSGNATTLQSLTEISPEITQLTSELTPTGIFDSSSDEESEELMEGHHSPNWSTTKSALILLGCTVLYSLIAEILIGSVDGFLSSFPISEKFLGLTLFAIAPTVTEFYNAISFAMAGNIALSLEIGSAYVIQVTLLQIPVLVGFSAFWCNPLKGKGFTLIFPPWDLGCIFFSVFLLSYIYIEGKSNYFKGSILLLTYCLLMIAFLFVPHI